MVSSREWRTITRGRSCGPGSLTRAASWTAGATSTPTLITISTVTPRRMPWSFSGWCGKLNARPDRLMVARADRVAHRPEGRWRGELQAFQQNVVHGPDRVGGTELAGRPGVTAGQGHLGN